MSIHFETLKIQAITDETPQAYTLKMEMPADEKFHNYLPGQYLTLKLTVNGEELRRSYSLSSTPKLDNTLNVTIKRVEDGRVSNYIKDKLKAGDTIEAMPPMGNFSITPNATANNHYILIGAGSGITPLMSMLRAVLDEEANSRVSLWYCNSNEESIIFKEQLDALGQKLWRAS
jgi:ring-1,2-phenylacetyl-CoA epoxidase subunit PaaE